VVRISAPWLQPGSSLGLAALAALFAVGAVARPQQAAWSVGAFFFGAAIAAARLAATRLVITDSEVRYDQGWFLRSRKAQRAQIRSIRQFAWYLGFLGSDGKSVLWVAGHWKMSQLTHMAEVLDVPLFDHRGWLGLRSVKKGRRVSVPGQQSPAR
jgi:hypothetical protein